MTDPITPERLAEIEARANAATEGPWMAGTVEGIDYGAVYGAPETDECGITAIPWLVDDLSRYPGTAEFIAAARTDVPALLAEVRRLQAAVERVRELHGPFRIYGECECEDTTTPGHVDIDEVGITCNLLYVACRECCTSGVDIRYQTEDCADGHDHRDAYCPTIAALDGDEQ